MENLARILENEQIVTIKAIGKKFNSILQNMIHKDQQTSIEDIANLFFNQNAKPLPSQIILFALNQFKSFNDELKFKNKAETLVQTNFWNSENPQISSLLNYSFITDSIFNGKEFEFLYILTRTLFSFPLTVFLGENNLTLLIEKYLRHISSHPFEIPQEFMQITDDAFDKKVVQTILATLFIKIADQKVPILQLSQAFSISLLCLKNAFPIQEISEMRKKTSLLFAVSLSPGTFLLLQSYFCQTIQTDELRSMLIQKICEFLEGQNSPEEFEAVYTAYLNVLNISEMDKIIQFLLRDFDTSYDEVRLVLMKCFDYLYNENKETLTTKLTPHIIKLPWYSRLKKFLYPYLLTVGNNDLFEDLLSISSDPQMKIFVTNCVKAILKVEANYEKFQIVIEKVASELDLTKPLLSFEAIFSVNPKFTKLLISKTNSYLIKFDSAISNPKLFASYISRTDIEQARKSFNYDLRIKTVAVFLAAGFPQNDEDSNLFVRSIPSLLMIDSQDHQTKLLRLFDELMNSLSKGKNSINLSKFIEDLNETLSFYLLPSYSTLIRQNALNLLETIWKRFPNISEKVRIKLESIIIDGPVGLKKQAYSISKYLNQPLIQKVENTRISELPFDPNSAKIDQISCEELSQFAILIEQNDIELNESHVIQLIEFDSRFSDQMEWEIRSELFHIISILCTKLQTQEETVGKATDHVFKALIETRKSGLVTKSYPYLSQLIKKLKQDTKPKDYCEQLVNILADFDMAQMRRSAGLPYICVSLIKGNVTLFDKLAHALVNICQQSTNSNEVANALNALNLILKESTANEKFYSLMFETIFNTVQRFPNEWDVVSAIDLAYNSLLHRIWSFYVKQTKFQGLSRIQFLNKVKNSVSVITNALNSKCPHSIYLALLLFTLFPRDSGDPSFIRLIGQHKSSCLSRIRRTAVRALLNVLPVGHESEIKINAPTMNEKHFVAIFNQEVQKLTDPNHPFSEADTKLNGPYPSLFEPVFNFDKIGSLCLTLRNWTKSTAPEDILLRLINYLIDHDATNMTYKTEGLKFLIRTLPLKFINQSKLDRILELYKKSQEVELKGLYLHLLKFVENASIQDILSEIIQQAADYSQLPIHHALSQIAELIIEQSKVATLFMLLNDVPIIRKRMAMAYDNNLFLNENEIIQRIVESMNDNDKQTVLKLAVDNMNHKIESDEFGEPIYFMADEFLPIFVCFHEIQQSFFEQFNQPMSLIAMRKMVIQIAKNYIK